MFTEYEEYLNNFPGLSKIEMLANYEHPLMKQQFGSNVKMFVTHAYMAGWIGNEAFFKKEMVELLIIESFVSSIRKSWLPTSGAGSQSCEWDDYLLLNKIVEKVCKETRYTEEED